MNDMFARVFVVAIVLGTGGAFRRVEATSARPRGIESALSMCDGTPTVHLETGVPACLRLDVSSRILPLEDMTVNTFSVSLDGEDLPASVTIDEQSSSVLVHTTPRRSSGTLEVSVELHPSERMLGTYYDMAWYELSVTWPTFFGAANIKETDADHEEHEHDEEHGSTMLTATFNPFPCTWFLGADYLCNSTTWMSA